MSDVSKEYEDRVVAFIDVLGFSNSVKKSSNSPNEYQKLYSLLSSYTKKTALRSIYAGFKKIGETQVSDEAANQLSEYYPTKVTQFSDSFIFSVASDNKGACGCLPFLIGTFIEQAFDLGLIVRGGVARGRFTHEDEGPAFGPAFLSAYNYESKHAIYSRVIFDASCLPLIAATNSGQTPFIEKAYDGFQELNLASYLFGKYENVPNQRMTVLNGARQKLLDMIDDIASDEKNSCEPKYQYLLHRVEQKIAACAHPGS